MDRNVVRVCIAGGGPAGMMLGFLLARAGIDVVVLEKHADFLRDFRGDTVHPSTLEVIYELGLIDAFLQRPHTKAPKLRGMINGTPVTVADFSGLRTHCKFIALMPQWEFLNFFAEQGRKYPGFSLLMRAEVTDLIEEQGRIAGVRVTTPEGPREIRATLVVGADGRHSTVRERAGLTVDDFGAPIDVLWMRLPKHPGDPVETLGYFQQGRVFVTLDRGDYFQCGLVIAKGGYDALQQRGLQTLRDEIASIAPFTHDRLDALHDWNDVKLLTVKIDRLRQWYRPGLLCIGDAAHAMSPMGGVGINLAIQDAVATANIVFDALRKGEAPERTLAAVQKRRMLPVRWTQGLQLFAQERVFRLAPTPAPARPGLPFLVKLVARFPLLTRIPALVVGVGFRPEHVRTPETPPRT